MQTVPVEQKAPRTVKMQQLEHRWTKTLIAPGWTAFPSVILECQHKLGLDAIDLTILMHLAKYWWYRDNPPHPSKGTIARCMGIDVSTVRRRIKAMEGVGFIKREPRFDPSSRRQINNVYHFDGLIEAVTPYAREALETKEQRKADARERQARKKARLTIVKSDEHGEQA
jgi:DNA-binding MarR family transcriptional regulator